MHADVMATPPDGYAMCHVCRVVQTRDEMCAALLSDWGGALAGPLRHVTLCGRCYAEYVGAPYGDGPEDARFMGDEELLL